MVLSEIDNLRILYKEIVEGYSKVEGEDLYIKHLDEIENIEIAQHKMGIYQKYVAQGVPSSEDRVKTVIANGQWDQGREDKILELKYSISDNEKVVKTIIPEQQGPIRKIIDGFKGELAILLTEKHLLLGESAETFAERESFNYLVYMSIYEKIDKRLFGSYEDFGELEETDLIRYGQRLEKTLGRFTSTIIAQIAVMPFFINTFSYVKENIFWFLNKPMSRLTHYQSALFSNGSRNINILSNTKAEPPELLDDIKVEDLALWYDKEYSILLSKRNSSS